MTLKLLISFVAALCLPGGWTKPAQAQQPPLTPDQVAELRLKADNGDAVAQSTIGYLYATGQGLPKDETEAAKWFRKAAEQGNSYAQNNLGAAFANGRGVPKDEFEAVGLYRKAAEQDYAAAQNNLGDMYANGRGVPKDEVEAVKWYRKAADRDDLAAQGNLGYMYASGQGVPKNDVEAAKWYLHAAEQGHVGAQYMIGERYAGAFGVSKNEVEAYKWWLLAGARGMPEATKAYEDLERKLTPTQRSEGQRMAREFQPRKGPPVVNPVPREGSAHSRPATASSSNPITSQGATVEDWSLFVGFLSVVVLVVSIVLHLRRRSATGTKPAPAPTVSVMPVQPQSATIYVLLNGNTQGPLSQVQVLDMVQHGQLLGETPAWKEGLADWKRLDQLVSLPTAHLVAAPSVGTFSVSPPRPAGASNTPRTGNQTSQVPPAANSAPMSSTARLRFGFLRCVRGFCGYLFGMQIVHLFSALTWLQQPSAITGNMLALVFFKVVFLFVFGALFFWLRSVINRLHTQEYGFHHPALTKKWAV